MAGALLTLRGVSDSVFVGLVAFRAPGCLLSLDLGGDTVLAIEAGAVLEADRPAGRPTAVEALRLVTTGMVGAGLGGRG